MSLKNLLSRHTWMYVISTLYTSQMQAIGPPTTTCDGSAEGSSEFNPVTPDIIWICKSGEWIPYR